MLTEIEVGSRIRKIRNEHNLDQKQFAQKIGTTVSSLSNWENGRNYPKEKFIDKISEVFNVKKDSIIGDSKLDVGIELYEYLLSKYDENSHTGKALRYFNKKRRNEIIMYGMNKIISVPTLKDEFKSVENIRNHKYLSLYIESVFLDYYVSEVKTNTNIIHYNMNDLIELQLFNQNYVSYDSLGAYSYKEKDLSIQLELIETGINQHLLKELDNIINDAKIKINNLFNSYPDEESRQGIDILVFDNHNHKKFLGNKRILLPSTNVELDKTNVKKLIDKEINNLLLELKCEKED